MRGHDVMRLAWIDVDVVEFVVAGGGVVGVFPVAVADAQEVVVEGAVVVGSIGASRIEEAVALPGGGGGEAENVGEGGGDVDMACHGVEMLRGREHSRVPEDAGPVQVFVGKTEAVAQRL